MKTLISVPITLTFSEEGKTIIKIDGGILSLNIQDCNGEPWLYYTIYDPVNCSNHDQPVTDLLLCYKTTGYIKDSRLNDNLKVSGQYIYDFLKYAIPYLEATADAWRDISYYEAIDTANRILQECIMELTTRLPKENISEEEFNKL